MPPYPQTEGVTYKPAPGFAGYIVGDDGSVWTCIKPDKTGLAFRDHWRRKSTVTMHGRDYRYVQLASSGVKKMFRLQRLVLETFVGPCPEGMQGCHNDGDPSNNRLSNLRWDTASKNHLDKIAHGTMTRGDRHPRTRLTDEDIVAIRDMSKSGHSGLHIAKEFGVCASTVYNVIHRRFWKHV